MLVNEFVAPYFFLTSLDISQKAICFERKELFWRIQHADVSTKNIRLEGTVLKKT